MPNTPVHLKAGGTIRPHRFVKIDSSNPLEGLEADANERVIGVCGGATDQPPLEDLVTTANHATDGDPIRLYGPGDETLLECGGTVTANDRLKSDADGKGVAIATTGTTIQEIGAIALEDGTSGALIRVAVTIYSERPALS